MCVLNVFVANLPFGDAELRALMEQNPAAIDASGKLNTLKLLAQAARADFAQVQVRVGAAGPVLVLLLELLISPWASLCRGRNCSCMFAGPMAWGNACTDSPGAWAECDWAT